GDVCMPGNTALGAAIQSTESGPPAPAYRPHQQCCARSPAGHQRGHSSLMTPFARRRRWTVLAVAAIAAATWYGLRWSGELPRRFAEVEPGKLYRGGITTAAPFPRLRQSYG